MHTQTLEDRETESYQRHDRQQCRVNEAHGSQRQLARDDVAQDGVKVSQDAGENATRKAVIV